MNTRRKFILGSVAAAGGLAIGWSLMPVRQRLQTSTPLIGDAQTLPLNGWVKLSQDGSVTVMISKSEMGQGVQTSLAMLLADEMDADWRTVKTEQSGIDKIYGNTATVVDGLPFHPDNHGTLRKFAEWMAAKSMREVGVMVTGGSSSIKDLWLPMRQAGASAREMLLAAAAHIWQVPASECRTENSKVVHTSGKQLGYGELVTVAAKQALPSQPKLKSASEFKLIGQPLNRNDTLEKINGRAVFGIDVRPDNLVYASVKMCPQLGGKVAKFDAASASQLVGVHKIFAVEAFNGGTGGVAAIADNFYLAQKALAQVKVEWDTQAASHASSDDILQQLRHALDIEKGFTYYNQGEAEAQIQSAAKTLHATYSVPYLAHATMEPMNCTVQVQADSAKVWVSTQVPGIARSAVAKVLGMDAEKIQVTVPYLGGGFGRRLEVDFIAQAAAIAKQIPSHPVQTLWSREEDMRHDFYRPACVSRWHAGFDAQGKLLAVQNLSSSQAIVPQVLKRTFDLPGAGPDKTTAEGAFDKVYEWSHAKIAHAAIDLPVPIGFWRSVGHSHQAFFSESFIDEMAHASQTDPVTFRLNLLQKHPRHRAVLQRAAELGAWGQAIGKAADGAAMARGVALHQSFGSIVAQVVEVSVDAQKNIRVHRVACVIDCGFAVNPNLIRQQLESSIVFGLSAALYGNVKIVKGEVQASNFHDQPVLRMYETPTIECDIIASNAHPEGVGEPGLPPIAPAVANALFILTGKRLRDLPLSLA